MRIGFDASPLARPHPPGIRRVVECSLAALERRKGLEVVRLTPAPGVDLRRWRQGELPRAVVAQDLVGVHSFLSAFPWRGPGKRVQTIHELPWRHGVKENAGLRHRLWASLGPRRADGVLTATETTARDLGLRRHGEGGKLFVVPWGVDERFQEDPPAGAVDEPLLDRYRLPDGPFLLALGAVRAKKNLAATLHGLARLKSEGRPLPQLIVTGGDTPDLRRDLGLAQRLGLARWVSTPGEIEDEHLPGVLRLAAAVVVLARSEGFGLPVLEALACGTPVVVPRASAQAEVAGPDAFVVDPDDPDSVAAGLRAAIEGREQLRYVLPGRAREFPWSRTAEGIVRVWEAIA
jgi:glycosyltransferase involved in cell wall biosynthesis